ncbi:winged helix-turn-helix domain-containing protein [Halarsenatibacter silvermanii]|uniref:Molybdate transport system regulatory protein n=1 Tax=Halarsenatibacter silvermanii TaxID=321763 RepID=A0A1G9I864_9FIRM|nr:LysR family transcriptional regulator [Halarsenatibacter silvermanii]SDL21460.1 molybdate transport system regulatory protein [Halarsenatibacter silvermanii]
MDLDINYKLWLEKDGSKVFGPGPAKMLELVDRMGSLKRAAETMDMSYSQAWNLLDSLEKRLGFELTEGKAGGSRGGGSRLTEKGRILLRKYRGLEKDFAGRVQELADDYFDGKRSEGDRC